MTSHINSLIGCRLFSTEHSNTNFLSQRRMLSANLIARANTAISFNGRHFEIDLNFLTDLPENVLALIQEKVRQTNLFIEDALDIQDKNIMIETPDGTIMPLYANQTASLCQEYNANISWHHIRIMLNPDVIKKGLRSGWSIAGLLLSKQTIKVACFRSRTNLRFVNHNIWFDYDILSQQVCCNSGVHLNESPVN